MQNAPCVECGEPLVESATEFGPWHSHCATLALSALVGRHVRGCPRCGELAPRLADGSIADYNDRRWHSGCAVDALAALVALRRRAVLMPPGRAPDHVETFAAEVWARLVDALCPSPGLRDHGPVLHPPRFRHECHACIDEDRAWLSERALQLVAGHLGGALRLLLGGELRRPATPPRDKAPE